MLPPGSSRPKIRSSKQFFDYLEKTVTDVDFFVISQRVSDFYLTVWERRALDGFTLHFLTEELRRDIVGCRVEKVHQPSKDELVMHLRDRNGAKKLFPPSANSPRVHLTSRAPENPAVPPMFCMLMRKHLTSAQITDVRQNGLDRVLAIDFSATNELGDKGQRSRSTPKLWRSTAT